MRHRHGQPEAADDPVPGEDWGSQALPGWQLERRVMRDEVPGEHERAADFDQRPEIEDEVGARAQQTESEDRGARATPARVNLPQPGGKLARLGHREHDARSAEQIAQHLRERSEYRRRDDDPSTPAPHSLPRRREQRRVLPSDLVRAEHAERDRASPDEHHRRDRHAAGNGDGNRPARLLDLARHDRHAHEPVPRPKKDRRPGKQADRSFVTEDRGEVAPIHRVQ